MTTYDLTFGSLPGLQMQAGAHVGVNFHEVDFADVRRYCPTLKTGDLLTLGHLPKGCLIQAVAAETVTPAQSGASPVTIQDDLATPTVILDGHDITSLGAISGPASPGSHSAFLTASRKLQLLIGATPPLKGTLRVSVSLSMMTSF